MLLRISQWHEYYQLCRIVGRADPIQDIARTSRNFCPHMFG